MLKNQQIIRTGSSPRTIFYSQTSGGHGYDYGKPMLQITGHSSRHIKQPSSIENKFVSGKKIYPQKNINKTINSIPYKSRNLFKNSKTNFSSLDNSLYVISNIKQKSLIKTNLKKNVTSYEMINSLKNNEDHINNINNNINNTINNNSFRKFNSLMKTNYDYKSEIVNLPGNCKRNPNEIKDDLNKDDIIKNNKIKTNSTAACLKKNDLYNSKIFCLNSFNEKNSQKNSRIGNLLNRRNKKNYKNVSDIIYSSNDVFYPNYENSKSKNKLNTNENFITNYAKDFKFKTVDNNGEELNMIANKLKKSLSNNYYNSNCQLKNNKNNNKNNNKSITSLKYNITNLYANYNSEKDNKNCYTNSQCLIPNYFYNVYNDKNSGKLKSNYITNSHKKNNFEMNQKLFTEVHQERPASLRTSYSYNKKNYSQITFA